MLGNAFEGPDFEWAKFNKPGFQYGASDGSSGGTTFIQVLPPTTGTQPFDCMLYYGFFVTFLCNFPMVPHETSF